MICTGNPNQLWEYDEYTPEGNVNIEMSEKQILDSYKEWWSEQMIKVGKANLISDENCIDDWIVVNWANEKDMSLKPNG